MASSLQVGTDLRRPNGESAVTADNDLMLGQVSEDVTSLHFHNQAFYLLAPDLASEFRKLKSSYHGSETRRDRCILSSNGPLYARAACSSIGTWVWSSAE